ncbi:MAG TPA: MG2 domain-containing protein, partial [Rhizomicrobium sp.]|nr:MG2 domain-containing protein [Rhizomicrobium sp.]
MNNRNIWIGAGLAGVVVIVLGVLYFMGGGGSNGPSKGVLERIAGGVSAVTGTQTPEQMAQAPEFAFHRLEIDTSQAQPQACLVFTRDLDVSGRTHYEDYVSIDPDTRIVVRPLDQRLCIAGLSFNATYTVTLKKGFPAGTGEKLTEDETVPVELRDKPSLVRFAGGIVLPRDNADGVPVTTINIDKLKLKIIRVGDRLLSQIESGTVDQTTLYSYDESQLEDNQGSLVWTGTMDVANVKNDSVVTLIPIRDILKGKPPGAYVLVAQDAAKAKADNSDDDYSEQMATQWVIDSDISITTFQGANGLAVFTRSYASAKALSGVKLTLVARNNNVLSTVTTDGSGRADFAAGLFNGKGGDEPVVVMAYGADDDFSFIDLRRPAFDLTDRGVGGRDTPGPIDAYLYTERGVYRPGETIHATAMLRDRVGKAVSAPLTLVATRPDGVEFARTTYAGASLAAGSAVWNVALRNTSPHGRWQIAAYIDPKASPVGRVQFDVADFVPQRLKVTLTAEEKVLHPDTDFHVKAESRFLYGAPASGLSGEGTAKISADGNPFPAFSKYQFGRVDDSFSDVDVDVTVPDTDADGVTTATGSIGDLADTTLPLKATIKVSIHEPGGRTTDKSVDVPVRTHDVAIGILPDFDGGSVAENARAGFEAIAVDANGKRIPLSGLTYSWVKENTTYQWYQDNGEWKYQSVTRDRLLSSGSLAIDAVKAARLETQVPWGTYRLTITDPKSGAASSYRFYSGWAASASGDRPDRIPVAADKPAYRIGQTAHVSIKPDADGQALVVVAGDKVFSSRLINAPARGTTVDIPVSADWGAGAYVLVTDYRALNDSTGREPVRSIGVAWLGVDNSDRTLVTTIGGPQKMLPRQHINIPVTLKGLGNGEDAYLTLAAVDEGILQLTDFKSPDPVTYYFGKRKLGVGMHDDYGRLIRAQKGPIGSLREGGDSFGGRPLAVVPTKTVALFSGLVKVGADGVAQVPIDVPDFNGELRLMAVAWTADKIGDASRPLTVRDPVVADIVLPRFLAPGDKAEAALNINNVEGPNGN